MTSKSCLPLSRRSLLKSSAALLMRVLPAPALITQATANITSLPPNMAGYQRLFPQLAASRHEADDLRRLAMGEGEQLTGMSAAPEVLKDAKSEPRRDVDGRLMITATAEDKIDDEENFGIPAGYTYLGQFIDNDLTLNPADRFEPGAAQQAVNLRTARFDLDSLYGRGPADQPYLYEKDGRRLQVGRRLTETGHASRLQDHPRINSHALIGDKRNDENVIVSQLHSVFRHFHNRVAADYPKADFAELRRIVTHHYQWMVLTDFLPRLCGDAVMRSLLPGFGAGGRVSDGRAMLGVTKDLKTGELPLEFATAAYRMGHSMVRPVYRLNTRMLGSAEERRTNPAIAGRRLIFAASQYAGLNGFRAFPDEWAIDWKLYFEVDRTLDRHRIADAIRRVPASYKIDTSLTNPLAFLPEFSEVVRGGDLARDANGQPKPKAFGMPNLAYRNLLRGAQFGMPSGQDVARALGIEPIADRHLRVGKATVEGLDENRSITDYGSSFHNNAPLWYYVLAEAQHEWSEAARAHKGSKDERDALPSRLGPVGARLVAESFVALMAKDDNSVLHADRDWKPDYARQGRFSMSELVQASGVV